jgi:hypothetical protein
MLDEQVENANTNSGPEVKPENAADKEAKEKRERSSIQFPYGDLDDATAIAKAIHSNAGTSCSLNQLAAYVKQSPSSSAFRLRVACARIFGLTELEGATIRLSETGKRVVDPQTEDEAKAHAFLAVPLYAALHKEYDGYSLPPPAALERKMNELGVSSKQTGKARQAFERSAKQAGFFAHGADRLVMPPFGARPLGSASSSEQPHQRQDHPGKPGGAGGGGRDLHPFIAGLLRTLPEPETEWPIRDRVKWLRTASQIFGLIYEGEGTIKVEVAADNES